MPIAVDRSRATVGEGPDLKGAVSEKCADKQRLERFCSIRFGRAAPFHSEGSDLLLGEAVRRRESSALLS